MQAVVAASRYGNSMSVLPRRSFPMHTMMHCLRDCLLYFGRGINTFLFSFPLPLLFSSLFHHPFIDFCLDFIDSKYLHQLQAYHFASCHPFIRFDFFHPNSRHRLPAALHQPDHQPSNTNLSAQDPHHVSIQDDGS